MALVSGHNTVYALTTGEMNRMKVSLLGQVVSHLIWLGVLVLQFASHTTGQSYTLLPQNLTSETGKSVTFQCGVSGLVPPATVQLSIIGSTVNSTVTCPGQKTTYLPAQSMRAHCESRSIGDVAIWDITGLTEENNATMFVCQTRGLDNKYGFLYVYDNSGYYGRIIGYGIGGFLSCMITIGVVYVLLKRSERAQQCFRSVGGLQTGQGA